MSPFSYMALAIMGGASAYFLTKRKEARVVGALGGATLAVVAVAALRPGGWLRPQVTGLRWF